MRRIAPSAVIVAVGVAVVALFGRYLVSAQQPSSKFDVASVRRNVSGQERAFFTIPPRGQVSISNAPLRQIIIAAFGIPPAVSRWTLVGEGAEPLLSERYDILGKPPDDVADGQSLLMLRALLEDRFKLRTHTEVRQLQTYALVVAREGRFGPNFRRSEHDCAAWSAARSQASREGRDIEEPKDADGRGWCLATYDFRQPAGPGLREAGPISQLVTKVQAFLDAPIVDATGLEGNFEWQVAFSLSPAPPIDSPVPSIYTAFEEQLGLKLERRRGPVEVLVIDSVQRPTEN